MRKPTTAAAIPRLRLTPVIRAAAMRPMVREVPRFGQGSTTRARTPAHAHQSLPR